MIYLRSISELSEVVTYLYKAYVMTVKKDKALN